MKLWKFAATCAVGTTLFASLLGSAAAQMITGPAVILLGEVYAKVQSTEAAAEPLARSRIA